MKLNEAMKIINNSDTPGFRVHFEIPREGLLYSGYFPDDDEELIENEKIAWGLAKKFALKTKGKYVNIYVVDSQFIPVLGYEKQQIKNR